ncbi:MAG: hypothetical protein K6C94_06840 [Candidatus Gastranaerophilales bacterium]|nr:hypothetical protein [Candidatus Gastranaerophilales bacterium]
MKKDGFSLAEILIMLAIVGVISILTLVVVINDRNKFGFNCYYFFRDLKTTVGHMGAQTVSGSLNSYSCEDAEEVGSTEFAACMAAGKNSEEDAYILDYRTDAGFCKGMGKYLGTASKIKCTDSDMNSATLSSPYGTIASGKVENFRLMNGYLVYISQKVTPATGTPYRVVSVDLNGNGVPNEVGKDILSFAVFDNGEVLPIGEAATDPKNFNAVIKMRNVMEMPDTDAAKQAVVNSMRHPSAIIRTANKTPLSFKDAYCRVLGSSPVDPTYCNGYTSFTEKFKMTISDGGTPTTVNVPVTICSQTKYNADGSPAQQINGVGVVAECEFNVIKPQVSKFIPSTQDVYSSQNNNEDVDAGTGEANQIYQY